MTEVVKATGAGFILTPADGSGSNSRVNSGPARIYPQVGETYDFSQAAYAWVCGKPYSAPCCGNSNGINVAGRKIRVLDYSPGSPVGMGRIDFEYVD